MLAALRPLTLQARCCTSRDAWIDGRLACLGCVDVGAELLELVEDVVVAAF